MWVLEWVKRGGGWWSKNGQVKKKKLTVMVEAKVYIDRLHCTCSLFILNG